MAVIIWIIAAFKLWYAVDYLSNPINSILQFVSPAVLLLLGFAIFRNKNDRLTKTVMIIFAISELSLPITLLIIVALLKKKHYDFVRKVWFVPAIVQVVLSIRTIIYGYGFFEWVMLATNVVLLMILGYWLIIRLADIKEQDAKDRVVSYYDDLLARGVITKEEYEEKTKEVK